MFKRTISFELLELITERPVVAIIGPRFIGKTTLIRSLTNQVDKELVYLNLESHQDISRLQNGELYLSQKQDKLIVLDEIQRMPALFPLIRSLIDRYNVSGRFILIGSTSPELLQPTPDVLAGQISYLELQPLAWNEINDQLSWQQHWLRGGYPDVLLAPSDRTASRRMNDIIQAYVERYFPSFGLKAAPDRIRTLLSMLVRVHANVLNASELARSLGVSVPTMLTYLDFLENTFLIRRLPSFLINSNKRLIKTPKLYLRDSGMFHALATIIDTDALTGSLYAGSSWEGYTVQQILAQLAYNVQAYFYRTADGSKLDLVLARGVKAIVGIEVSYTNTPELSRGNYIASNDLGNIPILVVTPSAEDRQLDKYVQICSINTIWLYLSQFGLINDR